MRVIVRIMVEGLSDEEFIALKKAIEEALSDYPQADIEFSLLRA